MEVAASAVSFAAAFTHTAHRKYLQDFTFCIACTDHPQMLLQLDCSPSGVHKVGWVLFRKAGSSVYKVMWLTADVRAETVSQSDQFG